MCCKLYSTLLLSTTLYYSLLALYSLSTVLLFRSFHRILRPYLSCMDPSYLTQLYSMKLEKKNLIYHHHIYYSSNLSCYPTTPSTAKLKKYKRMKPPLRGPRVGDAQTGGLSPDKDPVCFYLFTCLFQTYLATYLPIYLPAYLTL